MKRLIVEKEGPVWIVQFHNPPKSYMDQHTAAELTALLDEIESSETVRVVILTGSEPGVFIRHYDVSELAQLGGDMAKQGISFSIEQPVPESEVHSCLRRIENLPVPFIAAINGSAMGGGFETALACDLRLVQAGDYNLGLPEVTVGLLPGAGGTQRLSRLVGQSIAMQMVLLGNTISPQTAVDYGVAMECVEGDIVARAREIAGRIVDHSGRAAAHIKQLVRGAHDWSAEEGLANERTLFCDLMVAPDSLESMRDMVDNDKDIRDLS
ncbi:MAG: enoyl-CoA hydratase/carnithine racemase [Halioglobus sp.]|jgi:enoyl-CoA hydratase/carnithine racemase